MSQDGPGVRSFTMSRFVGITLASAFFLLPLFGMDDVQVGDAPKKPPREPFAGDREGPRAVNEQDKEPGFAGDRPGGQRPAQPIAIDGKRTMKYLDDICAIGPRISGTAGMRKQQELIKKHFEDLGVAVKLQTFTAKQISKPQAVEMANIIVSFHPDRKRRVVLCSHYDTRPIADQEPDERKWHDKFVSANDGGSGVALLMELGHHLKDLKTHVGVDLVFFDGEEYIWNRDRDKYFFGSEHFAREWRKIKDRPNYVAAVLL